MTKAIVNQASQSWLFNYAWRQKVFNLNHGTLSNDTIWDKLVFGPAREKALGRLGGSLTRALFTGRKRSYSVSLI
jgi:long-chain acyl-CoA synthetase